MKSSERWQEVKEILYPALEMAAPERSAFLDEKCGNDNGLRREVESLIAAHSRAAERFESPAVEMMAAVISDEGADDMVGKSLGHYDIIDKLGAGGMGDVYLARDNRLNRKVALKLLPSIFTQDSERLRRFQQEARAASALNHPNILTIHEVGNLDSVHYIATEFVDGESLRDHLNRARLKVTDALDIAIQIGSALATAHEAGIIHRDIKPENIMVRRDGIVKVVDFGLAKLSARRASGSEASTMVHTGEGIVMGTAQYMSPEQARGLKVDARTDIWSLGCVLYEMFAGRAPFTGPTPSDVIVSILEREPSPLTRYVDDVPAELDWLVKKALRKEPDERYQTSKELLSDLRTLRQRLEFESELGRSSSLERNTEIAGKTSGEQIAGDTAKQPAAHPTSSAEYLVSEIKRHKRGFVVALILGAAAVFTSVWLLLPPSGPDSKGATSPLRNANFTPITDQPGPEYFPSLSPDGKSFVYASHAAGNWDIYFQRVGGKNSVNLTKDSPLDDTQPAFSPDGERIAFRSEREGGGLFVMGATGESVKRLTNFGFHPAWSPDGKEIACADEGPVDPANRGNPNSRIWAVNVATGERRQVTKEDSIQPNWSPHGIRIAYGGRRNAAQRDIWTIPAGGGEPTEVTNDQAMDGSPVWSPDGKYLYFASDRAGSMNLWRVPIEEQTGQVLGPPEAVTTPSPYSMYLSFSLDGRRLVYSQILRRANLQHVGFDPDMETVTGQPVWITQGSRFASAPHLSPDGEWLAFSQGGKQEDLFVIMRDGTGLRQLTDDLHKDRQPRWSPDGKRIAFYSDRTGKWEIWVINSDGSGLKQLGYAPGVVTGPVWSPDGTRLAYRNAGGSPSIIEVEKAWTEQSPQVLPSMSDYVGWEPWSWSPDGRKLSGNKAGGDLGGTLVYSLETQHYEKLTDSGRNPVWLSDSRRLLFLNQSQLNLIDSQSKKVRELLSVAPNGLGGVTLSRDDRQIYFSLVTTEADIWLMSLEGE